MKKIDILTALIVMVSIFLFLKPNLLINSPKVGLTAINLVEGPTVPNGGRNGTAVVTFYNPLSETVDCGVHAEVSQFFKGALFESDTSINFTSGNSTHNISIFLPNGENKVIVSAEC